MPISTTDTRAAILKAIGYLTADTDAGRESLYPLEDLRAALARDADAVTARDAEWNRQFPPGWVPHVPANVRECIVGHASNLLVIGRDADRDDLATLTAFVRLVADRENWSGVAMDAGHVDYVFRADVEPYFNGTLQERARDALSRVYIREATAPKLCRDRLKAEGKPYPRSCPTCGIAGPCKEGVVKSLPPCQHDRSVLTVPAPDGAGAAWGAAWGALPQYTTARDPDRPFVGVNDALAEFEETGDFGAALRNHVPKPSPREGR